MATETSSRAGAASAAEGATAFQSGPAHAGVAAAANIKLPYERIWSIPTGTTSYPIIAQDHVIVTTLDRSGNHKWLKAFDARTGEEVWSQTLDGPYGFAGATYEDGRVFSIDSAGLVQAFDAATGASEWSTQVADGVDAAPTAAGGRLFVTASSATYALDEDTGAVIWQTPQGGDESSPAVSDGEVVVVRGCFETFATGLDGLPRWHHTGACFGGGGQTAAVWQGRVYLRDFRETLTLDGTTGEPYAAFVSDTIPAFDETTMFGVADGALHAVNLSSGSPAWTSSTSLQIVTAPLVVNDWVVAGGSDGQVYAFDRADGTIEWSADAGTTLGGPDEHDSVPLSGLGAAGPLLVVPGADHLVAFRASGPWTVDGVPSVSSDAAPAITPPTDQPDPIGGSPSVSAGGEVPSTVPNDPGADESAIVGGLMGIAVIGSLLALLIFLWRIRGTPRTPGPGPGPDGTVRPWLVGLLGFIVLPPVIVFGVDLAFGVDLTISLFARVLGVAALLVAPGVFAWWIRRRGPLISVVGGLLTAGAMLLFVVPISVSGEDAAFIAVTSGLIGGVLAIGRALGRQTADPPAMVPPRPDTHP
jgi:outer membrane protein assembly factor BamB